jgi:hypothetical protein
VLCTSSGTRHDRRRVAGEGEDLVLQLVQLRASATGKPLTDSELTFIASYPRELSLLYPGLLS